VKTLEKTFTITYRWWRNSGEEVKPNHIEALEEAAMSRIQEMIAEGYNSGQLFDNILMDDNDGKDGVEYVGWWEQKEE